MSDPLARLLPRSIWQHFAAIAAIPRPSKHEERIAAWVRELAGQHGFGVRGDAVGNLVVDVPASSGREGSQTVILQSHLDMVCEKNKDVDHDFMRQPIRPRVDGEWVTASGTTLGADNGIGVAAALAAATDPSVIHGPIELLFTLDEETGLTGAAGLDPTILQGRVLLNLDSEEDGVLFVGCAGGADCHLFLDPRWDTTGPGPWHRLEVTGLRGGHSGLNIHENRGNALKLISRLLSSALEAGIEFRLADLHGGSMHNAIPREAEASLLLPAAAAERLALLIAEQTEKLRAELAGIDDGLRVSLSPAPAAERALADADRNRLLRLLMVLPHGVLGMSGDLQGLVESSSNLAVVSRQGERFRIVTSSRSSVAPTMEALLATIRAAGQLAEVEVETHDGYPGWKPDMGSRVLQLAREVYAEEWGKPPRVTAIHAGLECGLIGEKLPGLEMISFGPQIEGAHSPDERVHVPSVERFWRALVRILDRLSA